MATDSILRWKIPCWIARSAMGIKFEFFRNTYRLRGDCGATSFNNHCGHARNLWNPECMTGGSSGGSTAAIAGSCALLA